jgi:hypothetical protein
MSTAPGQAVKAQPFGIIQHLTLDPALAGAMKRDQDPAGEHFDYTIRKEGVYKAE